MKYEIRIKNNVRIITLIYLFIHDVIKLYFLVLFVQEEKIFPQLLEEEKNFTKHFHSENWQ